MSRKKGVPNARRLTHENEPGQSQSSQSEGGYSQRNGGSFSDVHAPTPTTTPTTMPFAAVHAPRPPSHAFHSSPLVPRTHHLPFSSVQPRPPPLPSSYNPALTSFPPSSTSTAPATASATLSPVSSRPPPTSTTVDSSILYPIARPPLFPPGLDRYAQTYVPQWQKDVNESKQAYYIPRSLAESFEINYEALLDELYPRNFLARLQSTEANHRAFISSSLPNIQWPSQQASSIPIAAPSSRIIPVRPGAPPQPISPQSPVGFPPRASPVLPPSLEVELRNKLPQFDASHYAQWWIPLQHVEVEARIKQLHDARLYAVPIKRAPAPRPPPPGFLPTGAFAFTPQLYVLAAPSIREGWPPVDLGDTVELRQLRPSTRSFPLGRSEMNGTWQGLLFEATVAAVNRAKGEVVLRCDGLAGREESMVFNVIWRVQDRIFHHWRKATEHLSAALGADNAKSTKAIKSGVRSWLFPEVSDHRQEEDEEIVGDHVGIDESLNEEQKNAVKSILWARHKVPFLISGPPGTGKTKTLVEAVLQLLKKYPSTHILVCGASGPSADTLCMRLRSLSPNELFRMNAPSRPFAEVRGELLPFCHVEDGNFTLPSLPELLSKRVIVCTLVDAAMLLFARCSNHDLTEMLLHANSTVHPRRNAKKIHPHFGFLLVDEAAQASEPDLACALSVVAVDPMRSGRRAHVTICGDAKQLGPMIVSQEARALGLDTSLLERLAMRELYADHPFARGHRHENPEARWTLGTPFVDLVKNYRSAVPILMLPSTLFYNETLEPCAAQSVQHSPLQNWSRLPRHGWPILYHGVNGRDEPVDEGASFYNDSEISQVADYVYSLVSTSSATAEHGIVHARDISVISPFREQVWKIRLALRALNLHDVDVGNVEALQGAENRIVIISTVRSDRRWMAADRAQSRGLIHEPKRFNVAMTRAKELLIVIGNPNTLLVDPYWNAFYAFCRRNDAYVGVPIEDERRRDEIGAGAQAVSKLEQVWHATHTDHERRNGSSTDGHGDQNGRDQDRDLDLLVGRMVSSTLERE